MNFTRASLWLALALSAALAVTACSVSGGGGDDDGGGEVPSGLEYPVQTPAVIDDRSHFPVGEIYDDYTSNPPTSGPHAQAPAVWGISDVEVPKEMLVHNMEHAGVVVWYNCNAGEPLDTSACAELRNELGGVVQANVGGGKRVVMAPYSEMPSRIALTSWGFLDEFDEFDEARVQSFIDSFECHFDPEQFCG